MKVIFILVFFFFSFLAFAHEGHEVKKATSENIQEKGQETPQEGGSRRWTQSIGSFHLILLHFPIALINMLAVSESLLAWYKKPIFEYASRFLIISAAILSTPTALLGLIYSYSASYEGLMETFLLWHMWFGISTAALAIGVAFIRECIGPNSLYYFCMVLLVLMVNITGFFGGEMTFGPFNMYPA